MPLPTLITTLTVAGWLCLAAAPIAAVWPVVAGGPWVLALALAGAVAVSGLMLLGFAANLRLIADLVAEMRRRNPTAATPPPRGPGP